MRYLNRVFFINSANVKYAEIAIDGNVHFIGTQGVGKSTLLRAILFFYNADKLKLGIEKGKKTFDEYYFPFGNSYLVYEVVRETGAYCILAFKAQGRVCFRFLNGPYQQEHFITPDGKVRTWEGIRDALGKKTGYSRKIERYEEYRDVLYGNNLGVEKEFRKYALIESKQYQNLPRTIQNVFLNSKLDAEFIKQTIIMSLNEEDVKIELEKYALHLKDFDTQLADINKWTEASKSGEIPVRKKAENIARIHAAIQSLDREKQEAAIQLFHAYAAAVDELPLLEKQQEQLQRQRQTAQLKADDLKNKFQARREEVQKAINILDSELKKARERQEYYDKVGMNAIIVRVSKKDSKEAERQRLLSEQLLLNARFTEINSRYDALIHQQQQAMAAYENTQQAAKNKLREDFLLFKGEANEQYHAAVAEIRKQHQAALELARNSIAQKKDLLSDLKLKKQKTQLQRYYEQDIETTKAEMVALQQKIAGTTLEIADLKKQAETLQKQWELELEKNNAGYDRNIEKIRAEGTEATQAMAAIDAKLQKNQDSLYGWLGTHVPGWEHTIGKVIDEEQVLFQAGLAPQYTPTEVSSLYGLTLDLDEINRKVKTLEDYQQERLAHQQKADNSRNAANNLVTQRNEDADRLKAKFQAKIKDINNTRRQLEYEQQRAKGQLQASDVKLADLARKAAETKEALLLQVTHELEAASEALIADEQHLGTIEAGMLKQLDQKEKERNRKIKTEDNRINSLIDGLQQEQETREQEANDRIAEIKQLQTSDLKREGADTYRLAMLETELAALVKELDYINEHRDQVAEYNKDKRELFDQVDTFKTDKRLKENQLGNEEEKYQLQKQKLQQEIDMVQTAIAELQAATAALQDGIATFTSFKHTDQYQLIAAYEGLPLPDGTTTTAHLKQLIDTLNSKIFTIQERYSNLQTAVNSFTGSFNPGNIFGFKSNITERKELIEFAEMLDEFLEEDKIAQYEKRVNERFATLINQIGIETTRITSKGGDIQKVITEINRDFEERNFAGVIRSIRLQLSASQNPIVNLLQEIRKFNDQNNLSLGAMNLFSTGDNEAQNKKAVALLKEFAKEINNRKEKEISLPDSFELQFRIVENENDSGWVEKLTNVGSEGTDILVKAMINIMLLNVFKDSASKRFKEFRLHCMMDEIGKLHPNNVKGILKFANDRNILLINSSPTSYNATDYRYTYLLTKDSKHVTTIKRLVKKGGDA